MDFTFNICEGQVVKSKAGRDVAKVFVITKIIDKSYVYIVDGDTRKLANPKKKKIKHLMIYKDVIDLKVLNLNDSYIKKALRSYVTKEEHCNG